jgi:peptidoglycan biosynthesis protein MviN/MurJ (putative lipid II flippase)
MGLVWVKALVALDDTVTIAWIGLVAFLVNGVGNYVLSGALGVTGIALATSVMYLATTSIAGSACGSSEPA